MAKEALLKSLVEVQEDEERSGASHLLCEYCFSIVEKVTNGEGEVLISRLSRYFLDILRNENVLLPSDLRHSVNVKTNRLLGSEDFVREMKDLMTQLCGASDALLNVFIGNVFFKLFNWLLVFCLRTIRGQAYNVDSQFEQQQTSDTSHQKEFDELVYHIGGAILKGVLKKSKLYASNANWVLYGDIVKRKFTTPELSSELDSCSAHVGCFTAGRDRGGLTYCNPESFKFFQILFSVILSLEGSDGSLPVETVESHVFDNVHLIFLWDDLVGSELTESQSLYLFTDIVRICVKVSAKGILKRRLNAELARSYTSVALRHRLARPTS